MEHAAEKIIKDTVCIYVAVMILPVCSASCILPSGIFLISHAAVKCRHSEFIILLPLLRITKDIIRFCYFLKPLFCHRIARICVRMIFFRQLPVCAFDLLFRCTLPDTQHLIKIPFRHNVHLSFLTPDSYDVKSRKPRLPGVSRFSVLSYRLFSPGIGIILRL